MNTMSTPVRFNRHWVTIPWFVVGTPEPDLAATLAVIAKAVKAQQA